MALAADYDSPFAWEPNGTRLAFRAGDYLPGGITIVDAATGDVRVLTDTNSGDWYPDWSHNG